VNGTALHTLIQKVADHLGDGWAYTAASPARAGRTDWHPSWAYLIHRDGAALFVGDASQNGKPGMIHVRGEYLKGVYVHGGLHDAMNAAASKPATQLAAEIRRRILPAVIQHTRRVWDNVCDDAQREDRRRTVHHTLQAILPALHDASYHPADGGHSRLASSQFSGRTPFSITVTIDHHGNEVDLALSELSPALAEQVLATITAHLDGSDQRLDGQPGASVRHR
jgi:hypothetical protein